MKFFEPIFSVTLALSGLLWIWPLAASVASGVACVPVVGLFLVVAAGGDAERQGRQGDGQQGWCSSHGAV